MSGAMRKIGEYLGLLEDTGRYDEYDERAHDTQASSAREARRGERRRIPPAPCPTSPSAASAPSPLGVVAELSRITTLHPRTYNEAAPIGENFRDGTPVIMNLSEMDDTDAKRLVDFAAGLVFAPRVAASSA